MGKAEHIAVLRRKYEHLSGELNERTRRYWAATEAEAIGYGGIVMVCEATGMDHKTVQAGLREITHQQEGAPAGRIRRPGGGRKKLTDKDPKLKDALTVLVEPTERGDPESPLRWTTKSTTNLAEELSMHGHAVSYRTVHRLLVAENYSLQSNRKTEEGADRPDRDAQFRFISESAKQFQTKNQPVISVDTKKKELIGNFKNAGQEWRRKGEPRPVNMHDFADKELGKVAPFGVYDVSRNEGWVNVGIDHDTASFAVESIRRWWTRMGMTRYPNAKELLITADCGGSNANRSKLWKVELQKFADEFHLAIHVRHFPPGTSKWNKIEHRLFSFISRNWRGQPLIDRTTVVNLIAHTKTNTGLTVQAVLDENLYETGKKISDAQMAALHLIRESFHPEWNYQIQPRTE
jgi:Rhodopirellula transposase DDE domain